MELFAVDIPREKWLNCLQTAKTLIRCILMISDLGLQCLLITLLGVSRLKWVKAPITTAVDNMQGFVFSFCSSPRQGPGRAIALPSALVLASTLMLKFFKSLYFPDHLIDLVEHIWYNNRYSSKVLFSNSPVHYLKVKISSRSWT